MAQFDVYPFQGKGVPLVVDVQVDLLDDLDSRVVLPLLPENKAKLEIISRLQPTIEIQGKAYVLITTNIGTVPKISLKAPVTNLEKTYRQEILGALDFLLLGF